MAETLLHVRVLAHFPEGAVDRQVDSVMASAEVGHALVDERVLFLTPWSAMSMPIMSFVPFSEASSLTLGISLSSLAPRPSIIFPVHSLTAATAALSS